MIRPIHTSLMAKKYAGGSLAPKTSAGAKVAAE